MMRHKASMTSAAFNSRVPRWTVLVLSAGLLPGLAWGQIGGGGGGGGIGGGGGGTGGGTGGGGFGGVLVDTDGILRHRTIANIDRPTKSSKEKAARKNGQAGFAFVSLPRLFAAVKTKIASRQQLPEAMKYLEGIVQLQYVFVDPVKHDLVIAGPTEPLYFVDPDRPQGEITGRPALRLDDLVTALRTVGPGSAEKEIGCSMDLTDGFAQRMAQAARQIGAVRGGNLAGPARAIARAAGMMDVRIIGVPADSQIAFSFLEADHLLKRIALGLERAPVRNVPSHLALMRAGESMYNRYWFTPTYDSLVMAPDGSAYELRGRKFCVMTSNDPHRDDGSASPSGKRFADQFTSKFQELAERMPVLQDMVNVADLGVLAALIDADRLHEKAQWDLNWLRDGGSFAVAKRPVPRATEPLVNTKNNGTTVMFAVGGVRIAPRQALSANRRLKDEGGALRAVLRPKIADGAWSQRVSALSAGKPLANSRSAL